MTDANFSLNDSYFRNLVECAGLSIIGTDRNLTIRSCNQAAERMFGTSADLLLGTTIANLFPENERHTAVQLLIEAVEVKEVGHFEFKFVDQESATRVLIATFSPIHAGDGSVSGASACIRDITHRIRVQEQLVDSRKMASLGQMAGAMAHHFNNILGGIVTSVDYAIESNNPAVKLNILNMISEALGRATQLLKGLLHFAEGESTITDYVPYGDLLTRIKAEFASKLRGRNIMLSVQAPDLSGVNVPRAQIKTVLCNIIDNAVDAMPSGGEMRLSVAVNDDFVVTRVHDTGCGLDEESLSRVFEPFWSTKDVLSGGTEQARGLGLAIAHGIIQVLGGSISATSSQGQGSCFVFSIPRHIGDTPPV